jgi:hypothetical protein
VGGAVGGVIAVAIIFAVVWYLVSKNRRAPSVSQTWVGGADTRIPYDYPAEKTGASPGRYVPPTSRDEVQEMPGAQLRYPDAISGNLSP